MGSPLNWYCTYRIGHLITIPFLFLLLSSSTLMMQFLAQGGPITKLVEVHKQKEEGFWDEKMKMMMMMIGSTPPRCERRCSSCGECEAVQVPVTTYKRRQSKSSTVFSSRGDDISNYKPMSWKCKCGNLFFNP